MANRALGSLVPALPLLHRWGEDPRRTGHSILRPCQSLSQSLTQEKGSGNNDRRQQISRLRDGQGRCSAI